MSLHEADTALLVLLDRLFTRLRGVRDADGAMRHVLRTAVLHFAADRGAVAVLRPGPGEANVIYELPRHGDAWDRALLTAFIRRRDPSVPTDLLLAPIRRRGRSWGVLALARERAPFDHGRGHDLARVTHLLSEVIAHADQERALLVRDRIDRKIMERLRPQDLAYQILDGLRSLTRYDHSSALLMHEEDTRSLTLVAEQIAWKKGRSRRIGARLSLDDAARRIVTGGEIYGFERTAQTWREWEGRPVEGLAALLDYNRDADEVREGAMLVAPLSTRDGSLGLLKIAARHPEALSHYDADLVERFRYQAAIAIANARVTESLEERALVAERKHAMADLARGVSHDLNNALGSVIPLVQQMQRDVAAGSADPVVFAGDLEQIQKSLEVCRRIFGGMVAFARGAGHRSATTRLPRALEGALVILRDGLERRGIALQAEVPEDLPLIAGAQSDLEQILLNLITNARDAMPRGGTLRIAARAVGGRVEMRLSDTGAGIPAEEIARVLEPFYTTKPQGYGLGLSICRSLLWEMGGTMTLESKVGRGTTVILLLLPAGGPGEDA
jgi:signal transduction histidine kinase